MITAQQKTSLKIQDIHQDNAPADEIHFRLREALFSYFTQNTENRGTGPFSAEEVLTAKEIHACNMATD